MADAPKDFHPQTDVAASDIVSSGGFGVLSRRSPEWFKDREIDKLFWAWWALHFPDRRAEWHDKRMFHIGYRHGAGMPILPPNIVHEPHRGPPSPTE